MRRKTPRPAVFFLFCAAFVFFLTGGIRSIGSAAEPDPPPATEGDGTTQGPVQESILPPVPPAQETLTATHIYIKEFRFTGNTAVTTPAFQAVAAPYKGRMVRFSELQTLRQLLTRLYVDAGYITSGFILPEQEVIDGVVEFQAVEGALTEISITGNRRLKTAYIKGRLAPGITVPVNVNALQEQVRILHENPRIRRIDAVLQPGVRRGESRLVVRVTEARPYQLSLSVQNDRPPSVGSVRGMVRAAHNNLTGFGDSISFTYGIAEGVDDIDAHYEFPINTRDTTIALNYERSASAILEAPYDELDIESDSETFALAVTHPVFRNPLNELTLSLTAARRRSDTSISGRPYSFAPGVQDGKSEVTVLRFTQAYSRRSETFVTAVRSVFSFGVDALSPTINESGPDGRFITWLGQSQVAYLLESFRNTRLIWRISLQLSQDPLLPMEKFSIGGMQSVRGYRVNRMVRDNGLSTAFEAQVPLFRLPFPGISRANDPSLLYFAPFFDWGWAENTDYPIPGPRTISSAGAGLLWEPAESLSATLFWGYPFREFDDTETDLQDVGLHFQIACRFP